MPRNACTSVERPTNTAGPTIILYCMPPPPPNRRPGNSASDAHDEPCGSGELEPSQPPASSVKSAPICVGLFSSPSSAMIIDPVFKPSVTPPMNPLVPPMIAPSSMNEPSRAVALMRRNGPTDMRRSNPVSPPSSWQPAPRGEATRGVSLVTFAELEDITVGHQAAAGETLLVRGRSPAAGVWLEAQLTTGEPAPVPLATLRFAVYPDRYLPAVRGLRFFQSAAAQILP